jgi:endonuclease/exonuclease/phosphatase (EEP) superfamily protein YafD
MSQEDELARAGQLGDEVKAFIEGPIGQLILKAKDIDEQQAVSELMLLDPYKYKTLGDLQGAIAKLQENVILAGKVNAYLADAIIRGNQADELLMSEET